MPLTSRSFFEVFCGCGLRPTSRSRPPIWTASPSFLATFDGQATKTAVTTVTPTPSSTIWQALRTRVGSVSLFGFETPIPLDVAVKVAPVRCRALKCARQADRNSPTSLPRRATRLEQINKLFGS
jgi:hypothetical protein